MHQIISRQDAATSILSADLLLVTFLTQCLSLQFLVSDLSWVLKKRMAAKFGSGSVTILRKILVKTHTRTVLCTILGVLKLKWESHVIISSLDIADREGGHACLHTPHWTHKLPLITGPPYNFVIFFQWMQCLLPSKDDLNVNYHSNVEALKHPLYSTIIAALPESFMTFL